MTASCIEFAGGTRFCGATCGGGVTCPEGYACTAAKTATGATVDACVRLSGECGWPPGPEGDGWQTPCVVENGYGRCEGRRTCAGGVLKPRDAVAPAKEVCDGADQDCDCLTDQGIANCCTCGNGTCEAACGENVASCGQDCTACGNGTCDPGEGPKTCKEDCCGGCGDGDCRGCAWRHVRVAAGGHGGGTPPGERDAEHPRPRPSARPRLRP